MIKMIEKIRDYPVKPNSTLRQTMKAIDTIGLGTAFIIDDDDKLIGVVSDGDIRRAILRGVNLDKTTAKEVMNTDPITIKDNLTDEERLEELKEKVKLLECSSMKIPILDEKGKIKDISFLYDSDDASEDKSNLLVSNKPVKDSFVDKVLVIGGAGYLGSVLVRKLIGKGYKVRVLDILMYGDKGIKDLYNNKNFEFLLGDMRDIQNVMKAVKDVDAVIHLAAIVGDPASSLKPEETIEINYLATKMIAEVCKYSQVNRFLFASTCSVYGANTRPGVPLTEESKLNPVSLYAEMKLKSEQGVLELVDENFSPTILRKATIYGLSPRMRFDLVVNLLSAKAVIDNEITIFGGQQWRPNISVDDTADAYIKCLEAPISEVRGEIFNVGSNEQNYQISKIGEIINQLVPEAQIIYDKKDIDVRDYNVSFDKIYTKLNFKPKQKLEDAVLEIKEAFDNGLFEDYKDKMYSNYKFLSD